MSLPSLPSLPVLRKFYRTQATRLEKPGSTETTVIQAIIELENNVPDIRPELRGLRIAAAKELELDDGRKAFVIFVPMRQLRSFQKVQQRLTRELEKKFSDHHVVFVGQRQVIPKTGGKNHLYSRTVTSVQTRILEDLVYPTDIVQKRTRYAVDGTRLIRVFLDPKDATSLEYKLDSLSGIYKRLTNKAVVFEFPVTSSSE
ncbi:40S ribosomal protein S7 [Cantharellus anzutake]|uniref:40S ribosomal protein S7 n=1 Tax=Cantharellus anzutake TaxID=1750568 RepID=UPI0019077409|nr:40S ribosomal protein S7 [Cantharellus anzutake]KAF8324460.1 40S ribosomal protein S7 [Cantharellus anzutake]